MHGTLGFGIVGAALINIVGGCAPAVDDVSIRSRLVEWRQGVWISGSATYTIYTASHYFVVSLEGDTLSPNLYVAASQICYHDKGTARRQLMRFRQYPGGVPTLLRDLDVEDAHGEPEFQIDSTLFVPGTCTIKDGVIYDAVTEVTDTSILLSTCNGDKEIIYANGVSAYLPASGGEFLSYRIEP
jgi:hypothetical protein